MQPLDALTLQHYAAELDLKLADGKINKIQQASHYELLLNLWVGGDASRQKLYINIRPEYAFCALVADTSFLSFPAVAPNFCMVLRKHLTAARIKQIRSLPDERVLNIEMENFNELGQHVQLTLSIEMMGKNSNIILYDPDVNVILGCAHGVSEEMSRKREISVGYPYALPPKPDKRPIRSLVQEEFVNAYQNAILLGHDPAEMMAKSFFGVGTSTLRDLFQSLPDPQTAYGNLQEAFQGIHLYPALHESHTHYSLLGTHQGDPDWKPATSFSHLIEQFYVTQVLKDQLTLQRHQFRQIVKAQQKKLNQRRAELQKSDTSHIAALKKTGDLLMIAASQHQPLTGNRIVLEDFESGEPITIELEPDKTLSENAQFYYQRYKKAQTRYEMGQALHEQLENTHQYLQMLSLQIDLTQTLADLDIVREDLESQGWLKPTHPTKKSGKKIQSPPMTVVSSDGFTLLVGKNNLQNDTLVRHVARPDDIWLHAHLIPGSHVIIKTEKRQVPDQTLYEAALLAAYYSQARESANVPIIYTQARYVRKIPNSYPGHVTYTEEKGLNVTPSPENIQPLLQG